jgi:hypothetical protein
LEGEVVVVVVVVEEVKVKVAQRAGMGIEARNPWLKKSTGRIQRDERRTDGTSRCVRLEDGLDGSGGGTGRGGGGRWKVEGGR